MGASEESEVSVRAEFLGHLVASDQRSYRWGVAARCTDPLSWQWIASLPNPRILYTIQCRRANRGVTMDMY